MPSRSRWGTWLVVALAIAGLAWALTRTPRPQRVTLTPDEQAWLARHGPIVQLTVEDHYPPLSFVDDHGVWVGIAADVARALEERLPIRFEQRTPTTTQGMLDDLEEGRAEVSPSLSDTPERARFLLFTEPYLTPRSVVLVRQGTLTSATRLEDLRGVRVAVGEGFSTHEYLRASYPDLTLVPVPDEWAGIERLLSGEVDALMSNPAVASWYIQRENIGSLRIAFEAPYRHHHAFAITRREPVLYGLLQKGLAGIRPSERDAIWRRWVKVGSPPFWQSPAFWRFTAITGGALGALIAAALLWNHQLRRQVDARTALLADERARATALADESDRQAKQLRTILDAIADGVLVCDASGRIILCNPAVLRRLGDALPSSVRELIALARPRHLDGRPIDPDALPMGRALAGASVVEADMAMTDMSTGDAYFVHAVATPIRAEDGSVLGGVEILRDVTASIAFERLKDEFVQVAGHELRTPVAILKSQVQLLDRRDAPLDERQRRSFAAIKGGIERIERIVTDLVSVTSVAAGTLTTDRQDVDLVALVDRVADRVALTTRHRVQFTRGGEAWVSAEPVHLERAVGALIENAVKFSPAEGEVEVDLTTSDEEAHLTVRDQGLGIPAADHAQLFDLFYRAHGPAPYDYTGLGVGLYLAREIVTLHGGQIWFETEEGKGSTFHVKLPTLRTLVSDAPGA